MPAQQRFTSRCAKNDLSVLPAGIADGIRRKVQNRIDTASIESGDRYLAVAVPKMFTEHQGDFRAVTWFDETMQVVWICAVGRHYPERGERRDLYEVAHRLDDDDKLLPQREDYLALEAERARARVDHWREEGAKLRQSCDRYGEANAVLMGAPIWVRRLEIDYYELSFEQRLSVETATQIMAALFGDQREVEWAVPERDNRSGVLYQHIYVLTG